MLTGSTWRRGGVASSRSCSTRPSSRSTSRMMMSAQRRSSGSARAPRSSWAAPLIPPRGFRISCASPLATVPSAVRRSARRVVGPAAGFRSATAPVPSTTITASSMLARTSAQGGRDAPSGGGTVNLEIVLVARAPVPLALLARPFAGLELVDHLVEVLAGVLAELLSHLAHPARHALGIVLVETVERGRIGQVVEPALLGADHREARHEAGEIP